jgi:probable phosphoglycerate mutase
MKTPEPPGDPIQAFFREALLIGSEATRLYLVRHAQSQGNTGEDLTTGDPDLTDVGREQAGRLAARLASQRINRVYASPLRRTQQTAEYIADACGLEVIPKADLREVSLGQAGYDIRLLPPEEQAKIAEGVITLGTWDAFPGSEGSETARKRARSVMEEICGECEGRRAVIVSHAAFIQTFVSVVLGIPRDFVFYPFNAGITSVRHKAGAFVLWRVNDVAHLDGLPAGWGGIS